MECTACHESKHALFCKRCLNQGLKNHTDANHILTTQLKASRTRCQRILSSSPSPGLDAHRSLAGRVYELETQNRALGDAIHRQTTTRNNARRLALCAQRQDILRRRAHLARARAHLPDDDGGGASVRESIASTVRARESLAGRITHARRVLVRAALDVFGVRPSPSGGQEEWEVAGIRMPPPGRFTEYPSTHLNASFDHLVHLLGLITRYLDVQLPFPAQWQGLSPSTALSPSFDPEAASPRGDPALSRPAARTPHIGKLLLSAGPSLPFLRLSPTDTADFPQTMMHRRAMLYVSSSREKWKRRQQRRDPGPPSSRSGGGGGGSEGRDKHRDKEEHLVLGYTMLLLDLIYLGSTQGLPVWGEEQALPHPLEVLDSLRHAEDLGRASHTTPDQLRTITLPCNPTTVHASAARAFAQDPPGRVIKERRRREKQADDVELGGDDWDLV
ncbi:hypothetical protein NCC49_003656 [Naganishia albida]|nr:hypothetical protein NCC49_003656 [Naganishia albida]